MKTRLLATALLSALCLAGAAAPASADVVPFTVFENATNTNVSDLKLTVDVSEESGKALFNFKNESTIASSITLIAFEDGFDDALDFSGLTLHPSAGVTYQKDGSAKNVPGGNTISFSELVTLSRTNAGGVNAGINPGENLLVKIPFLAGKSLANLFDGNELTPRIAEHIQSVGTGAVSVAAVTTVPEPATAGLMMAAAAGLLIFRRRSAAL